ncbi:type IV secretion system protein VirB6 [Paraburkholderia silvatlantica]|uniref:Type IV secretion system protein VirB6 n=1 Tax=Paraburkholderia silvatlantica TaxID=321895 RepID=A0ABR6FSS0_9BURK|nr:type IV secretion system protein [Paraburkholderia silvatlantica]MBB2930489.1 type IV secretion system protein VirB6 [Paraburkholderia silvatlantica]PVY30297.1 type IV secretion system protein VirB6 [Paraburkholderia silvatlantica]PXW36967.1 type IV secretion system protein VirB6 [Paraburkholderia silvatlantica]
MSGFFTAVGGMLENGMSTYVTSVSSALSSAIVPVVTTEVTVWIVVYGIAVIRGEAHESVLACAWRSMKMAVILSIALGSGIYQSQVLTAVEGAKAGLAQTIRKAAASAGAGNAGCGTVSAGSVTGSSAAGIYQTLDCYDRQIDLVVDAYGEKSTHEGMSIAGIVAAVCDAVNGWLAGLGGAIFLIVLTVEVMMARMLLDLVVALGPIFIACAAFWPTARFFEAWTAKIANYALLQVLVAAFLGLALAAFSADLAPFQVTTAAPDANASALPASAQTTLETVSPAAAVLGMLVTGLLFATIGWQLPAVASGLVGGATMSGFGAFSRAMSRVVRSNPAAQAHRTAAESERHFSFCSVQEVAA